MKPQPTYGFDVLFKFVYLSLYVYTLTVVLPGSITSAWKCLELKECSLSWYPYLVGNYGKCSFRDNMGWGRVL